MWTQKKKHINMEPPEAPVSMARVAPQGKYQVEVFQNSEKVKHSSTLTSNFIFQMNFALFSWQYGMMTYLCNFHNWDKKRDCHRREPAVAFKIGLEELHTHLGLSFYKKLLQFFLGPNWNQSLLLLTRSWFVFFHRLFLLTLSFFSHNSQQQNLMNDSVSLRRRVDSDQKRVW